MSEETFSKIASSIKEVNVQLNSMKGLMDAMQEAGEDVTDIRQKYNDLTKRKNKWEMMLKNRGYAVV